MIAIHTKMMRARSIYVYVNYIYTMRKLLINYILIVIIFSSHYAPSYYKHHYSLYAHTDATAWRINVQKKR